MPMISTSIAGELLAAERRRRSAMRSDRGSEAQADEGEEQARLRSTAPAPQATQKV